MPFSVRRPPRFPASTRNSLAASHTTVKDACRIVAALIYCVARAARTLLQGTKSASDGAEARLLTCGSISYESCWSNFPLGVLCEWSSGEYRNPGISALLMKSVIGASQFIKEAGETGRRADRRWSEKHSDRRTRSGRSSKQFHSLTSQFIEAAATREFSFSYSIRRSSKRARTVSTFFTISGFFPPR